MLRPVTMRSACGFPIRCTATAGHKRNRARHTKGHQRTPLTVAQDVDLHCYETTISSRHPASPVQKRSTLLHSVPRHTFYTKSLKASIKEMHHRKRVAGLAFWTCDLTQRMVEMKAALRCARCCALDLLCLRACIVVTNNLSDRIHQGVSSHFHILKFSDKFFYHDRVLSFDADKVSSRKGCTGVFYSRCRYGRATFRTPRGKE